MIDIHSHILPYDDGPSSVEMALELCRSASEEGITTLVYTPHLHLMEGEECPVAIEQFRSRIREFTPHLKEHDISLNVLYGVEVRLSIDTAGVVEADPEGMTINHSGKYILLEMPFYAIPVYAHSVVFDLMTIGVRPIIAHIERCADLCENPEKLKKFVDIGCLTQVNSNSLTGAFGRRVKKAARNFLKQGLVTVLAGDVHTMSHGDTFLTGGLRVAEKTIGKQQACAMVEDIPRWIVEGKDV